MEKESVLRTSLPFIVREVKLVRSTGEIIVHPTLGRGAITKHDVKPIKRDGYVAKLIYVKFDCGQSCVFHSRVEHNEKISESLAEEVARALQ